MDKENISSLIEKYVTGSATDEERDELLSWYRSFDHDQVEWPIEDNHDDIQERLDRVLLNLKEKHFRSRSTAKNGRRLAYAAMVLFVLGFAIFFYLYSGSFSNTKLLSGQQSVDAILPGGNKARLTLSDGAIIELNDEQTAEVLWDKGSSILKNDNGELVYTAYRESSASKEDNEIVYNTLETPKGGQYQVLLPDGSRVWLNAESSLYFPTDFVGTTRKVELRGEAYFEITKNADMPFVVSIEEIEIEVLGTQFNVKAYPDENNIYTTLVEGAVRVSSDNQHIVLKPGEYADYDRSIGYVQVGSADKEASIAWKNGYFIFNNEDIRSIMLMLSRWYDVDVEYKGQMEDKEFTGRITRRSQISEVLKMLELTGTINFETKGRRIVVMP